MPLKDQITDAIKDAMRAKDKIKLNTLRFLQSDIRKKEIDEKITLEDSDVIKLIQSQIKRRRESIDQYEKAGRTELAEQETAEIEVLSHYLPKALPKEELESIIVKAIEEVGATSMKEMGLVMKAVLPQVEGRAEGKEINQIVREKLQNP